MAYKRLGDILISFGAITNEELDKALSIGREKHKRLGQVLIEEGLITERQLIDVLKIQLGVDYIDLTTASIPAAMASQVPKSLAVKYNVVPVKTIGNQLYLAMEDPLNFVAIEEVRNAAKKRVVPMITTKASVERAVVALYGSEGMSKAIDDLEKTIVIDAQEVSEGTGLDDPDTAPAIRLVNSIIERAAAEKASDIHIECQEEQMVVRMRIDGVLHTMLTIPSQLKNAIISRIKIMGEMNIAERRLPQDGRANVRVKEQEIDLRISTLPMIFGEKIVIRLLTKSEELLSNKGIGLEGDNLRMYQELIQNANGAILIVGPTGSGKSSTMYTMVSDLNKEEVNIVTLEDPVEYHLKGINQVQINDKIGLTFANALRSVLRQDPDIVAVGEIRDGETGEIAMRAAITGHLVLSTIHTNDAISALDRLTDIGIEPYILASAIKGIISQRLVRRICNNCKTEYVPTEEELAELKLPEHTDVKFYKGTGCPDCLYTGYRGRTAAFEILMMTGDIKRQLRNHASDHELRRAIEASGFKPMMAHCRELVLRGTTTVAEARRILHSTDN